MAKVKVAVVGTVGRVVQIDQNATYGALLGLNLFTPNGVVGTPATVRAWLGLQTVAEAEEAGEDTAGTNHHRLLQGLTLGDDHPQYTQWIQDEIITGSWHFRTYDGILIENPDYLEAGIELTTYTGSDPLNNGIGNQLAFWEVGVGGAFTSKSYGFRMRHTGDVNGEGDLDWYRHENSTTGVLFMKFTRDSSQIQFADGTAALPVWTNIGDTNTGMYFPAANSIGFSTGGVLRLQVEDDQITASVAPRFANTLSPTSLAADQNNYSPTNLTEAMHLRLAGTAARSITGLATGENGRWLTVTNVGSFDLTFVHESASSTAANRFTFDNALSFVLGPAQTETFWYDTTSSRWRALNRVEWNGTLFVDNQAVTGGNARILLGASAFPAWVSTGNTVSPSATSGFFQATSVIGQWPVQIGIAQTAGYTFGRVNTSLASPSVLLTNQGIGGFIAGGYDGSNFRDSAAVFQFVSDGNWSTTSLPTRLVVQLTPASSTTLSEYYRFDTSGLRLGFGARLGFFNSSNAHVADFVISGTRALNLRGNSAASPEINELILGFNARPVQLTLIEDVNIVIGAGSDLTIGHNGTNSILTNITGNLIFTTGAGTAFTFNRPVRLAGFTVATLPAGTIGDTAYVTDAAAPVWGAAVAGGGAVMVPVYYTGAAWFVG